MPPFGCCNRTYEDIEPYCRWRRGEDQDILEVHVPGFLREQLKIKVNNLGILTISGKCPSDQNKWRRFEKNCNISGPFKFDKIHAKFSKELESLIITIPKKTPSVNNPQQDHEGKLPEHQDEQHGEKQNPQSTRAELPTVLKSSIPRMKMSEKTACKAAEGLVAVMVLVGVGTFIMYKYRQTFHNDN